MGVCDSDASVFLSVDISLKKKKEEALRDHRFQSRGSPFASPHTHTGSNSVANGRRQVNMTT